VPASSEESSYTLTKQERKKLKRREQIVQIISMKLDPDVRYTLGEIAAAVGVSVSTVKRMIASDEFKQAWMAMVRERMSLNVVAEMVDKAIPKGVRRLVNALEQEDTDIKDVVRILRLLDQYWTLGDEQAALDDTDPVFSPVHVAE